MATLTSSLIVSLIDRVTGPARAAANAIKGIGQAAAAANSSGGLATVAQRNSQALAGMRASMLEAAAVGYGLARTLGATLSVAGNFESTLLDIAQKADLSDGAIKNIGASIRALAPQINQTAQSTAKALDSLVGFGLDPDLAVKLLGPMGKAATAYKAQLDDLAKASFSITDNMKVPVEQLTKALDIMAQSGKMGAFELRDMAAEFPALTAGAAALEMKGTLGVARLTAALQIARKGAATGAEAATNTANLMQKIVSPDTVKNFAKFGIDIRKELKKTQDTGGDVFEMIAAQVTRATKGDMSKLGDVFSDKQVQEFLRPLLANLPEYIRIRNEALKAEGVVNADFDRRMLTFNARIAALKVSLEEIGMVIGETLIAPVQQLVATITPAVKAFGEFAKANPALVSGVIKTTTAVIAITVAARAAQWSFLFLRGGVLMLAQPLLAATVAMAGLARALLIAPAVALVSGAFRGLTVAMIATVAATRTMSGLFLTLAGAGALGAIKAGVIGLGAALVGLLNPIALVRGALHLLKLAVIGTGIGAILVTIAAAGLFIYENWSGLGEFFTSFGSAFMAALGPLAPAVTPLIEGIKSLWDTVSRFFGEISPATWQQWGTAAGAAVGAIVVAILDLPNRISTLASDLYNSATAWMASISDGVALGMSRLGVQLYDAGASAMGRLWDGLKEKVAAIKAWFSSVIDDIIPESVRSLVVPALPAPRTTPDRPQKALPRVADNPEEAAAAPPLMVIGRSEPPPAGAPPAGDMSLPVDEAAAQLDQLNQTVGPSADLAGLTALNQAIERTKANIRELNGMQISIPTSGGALAGSGSVARRVRGEHSDAGM